MIHVWTKTKREGELSS